jgi:tetratricopeptide (TPR) repeat protein
LSHALRPYWRSRGSLALGHRVTIEALSRSGAQDRSLERCRGLFDAGSLAAFMGRYPEARGYLEESLAIARELGDRQRIAAALQPLGMACLGMGNLAMARKHLEDALELARSLGSKRELAAALNNLAQLFRVEGELDAAEPLYEQMLALVRELGDRESVAIGLLNLAMVAVGRERDEQARTILLEVLAIAADIGSRAAGQSVLEVCAGLASLRKQYDRAGRFYGAAEALATQTGLHRAPADDAFLEPLVAKAREALDATAFDAAEAGGRALSYEEATQEARAWLSASRS